MQHQEAVMPEISRFFGLVITMNYNDHSPPHFHARYGSQRALIGIESGAVLRGRLPPRALGMIVEWASLHHEELLQNWDLARRQGELNRVDPLE
jgi:hypothetical protein